MCACGGHPAGDLDLLGAAVVEVVQGQAEVAFYRAVLAPPLLAGDPPGPVLGPHGEVWTPPHMVQGDKETRRQGDKGTRR